VTEVENLLRKLRGRLAFKSAKKPYVIFNDETLGDLLKEEPKTIEALSAIKGFPADGKRVAAWGQAIVDIFNKPDKIEDFDVKLDADGEPQATTRMKKMNAFG
jgi:ribonuclease D